MAQLRSRLLVVSIAALAGCGQDESPLPLLTDKVFFEAAKECDAADPVFIFKPNRPPRVGFTVPSAEETSGKTAQCLADRLAGYQLEAMEIKVVRPSLATS
jgi:hypothetical protein